MAKGAQQWAKDRRRVCVVLSRHQDEILRRTAERRQTSISDLVRRAINEFFLLPADIPAGNDLAYSDTTTKIA